MRRSPLALVLATAGLLACGDDPPAPAPAVPANSYCESVADWDPAHAAFEVEVVELVNERRADSADCGNGGEFLVPSEPLIMDPALRCAARQHTLGMIEADNFDHESPDGETFEQRTMLAEYDAEALAQIIAAGQREPAQVVATWMSNDGNCAKLMDPEATEIGVGYLPADGVSHAHYWTNVFGRRE